MVACRCGSTNGWTGCCFSWTPCRIACTVERIRSIRNFVLEKFHWKNLISINRRQRIKKERRHFHPRAIKFNCCLFNELINAKHATFNWWKWGRLLISITNQLCERLLIWNGSLKNSSRVAKGVELVLEYFQWQIEVYEFVFSRN